MGFSLISVIKDGYTNRSRYFIGKRDLNAQKMQIRLHFVKCDCYILMNF